MPGFEAELIGIIFAASGVIKAVLIILLLFSVFSWTIIFYKLASFIKARRENKAFLSLYWKIDNLVQLRKAVARLKQSPLGKVFMTALDRIDSGVSLDRDGSIRLQPDATHRVNVKILERTLKRTGEEQLGGFEHYLSRRDQRKGDDHLLGFVPLSHRRR